MHNKELLWRCRGVEEVGLVHQCLASAESDRLVALSQQHGIL